MQKIFADAFFRIVADFISSSILLSIICMDISWIQIFWYMLKYKLFNESSSQFGCNLDDTLEVIPSFSEPKWSVFQNFISQRNSEVLSSKFVSEWRGKIKISSRHFFCLIDGLWQNIISPLSLKFPVVDRFSIVLYSLSLKPYACLICRETNQHFMDPMDQIDQMDDFIFLITQKVHWVHWVHPVHFKLFCVFDAKCNDSLFQFRLSILTDFLQTFVTNRRWTVFCKQVQICRCGLQTDLGGLVVRTVSAGFLFRGFVYIG